MTLRVVHINPVAAPRGMDHEALLRAWPTLGEVAAAVARAGAQVTVLQPHRAPCTIEREGVVYHFLPELLPARLLTSGGSAMVRAIRGARADVVHFNGLEHPFQLRAACAAGVPVLAQDHKSLAGSRKGPLRRWAMRQVKAVAFTSAAQAEPFRAARQLGPHASVFAISESSSHFTPGDPYIARRDCGMWGDPALLSVGHLAAHKDPVTVLEAVRLARLAKPGLQLWCAFSRAELMPQVQALLASDLDLAARVHLLGEVSHPEIETLCRAADYFVTASLIEGSGYALIEAMACGLPVIASDIAPFRALTADGAAGALAKPGDPQAFARAIEQLPQAGGAGHQALRLATRRAFDEHIAFAAVGEKLVEAYRSLLSNVATA